jgi:hypothetical protein
MGRDQFSSSLRPSRLSSPLGRPRRHSEAHPRISRPTRLRRPSEQEKVLVVTQPNLRVPRRSGEAATFSQHARMLQAGDGRARRSQRAESDQVTYKQRDVVEHGFGRPKESRRLISAATITPSTRPARSPFAPPSTSFARTDVDPGAAGGLVRLAGPIDPELHPVPELIGDPLDGAVLAAGLGTQRCAPSAPRRPSPARCSGAWSACPPTGRLAPRLLLGHGSILASKLRSLHCTQGGSGLRTCLGRFTGCRGGVEGGR